MKEKELEKLHAQKLQEEYIREMDKKEKQRAEEWAAREARIQNIMGRMADTVIKKNQDAEREFERQLLRQAEERDKKAEHDEKRKKDAARKRDMEIKKVLDQQLREKHELKERELQKNKEYVAMVIARDEADKKE